jgi:glucose/arabinose dehydrogenase
MHPSFKRTIFAASVLAFMASSGAWAQGAPRTFPQDPATAASIQQNLKDIKMPPGFKIELYATVPGARAIAVDPTTGTAYIGTRKNAVWVLNHDGNGKVSQVTEFSAATGFKDPNGVCFAADGTLFVAELNRILSFSNPGSATPTEKDVVPQGQLIPVRDEAYNHGARVCRVGPDGKLYVAVGEHYNVLPPEKYDAYYKAGMGAIVRYNLDGSGREIYAHGIRNSVGLDFNPKDKTLWFTDNQTDNLGDDRPPGELNRATKAGQDFGYPFYGGGHDRTVEYQDKTPPAGVIFPQVNLPPHAADLGMSFYEGTSFPKKYVGGIFDAEHGSWVRKHPLGARIMYTHLKADGTAAGIEVFASGWLTADGQYKGRPVDVEPMKDGSLLVSDDFASAVYRISYVGK